MKGWVLMRDGVGIGAGNSQKAQPSEISYVYPMGYLCNPLRLGMWFNSIVHDLEA